MLISKFDNKRISENIKTQNVVNLSIQKIVKLKNIKFRKLSHNWEKNRKFECSIKKNKFVKKSKN